MLYTWPGENGIILENSSPVDNSSAGKACSDSTSSSKNTEEIVLGCYNKCILLQNDLTKLDSILFGLYRTLLPTRHKFGLLLFNEQSQ